MPTMAARGEDRGAEGDAARALAGQGRTRRLAWSTAIFFAATGASRVLVLFREVLVRLHFGVEVQIIAFTDAF